MYEFSFGTFVKAFFVTLEVFKAAQGDAAEGFDGHHLRVDGCRFCLEGKQGFVQVELVAALSLAGDGGMEVVLFLQFSGEAKNVFDLAREQFEFDFADGRTSAAAFDIAAVNRQFDQRFTEGHMPDLPPEVGGENGFELFAGAFKKVA
jgi:hypothetical protein